MLISRASVAQLSDDAEGARIALEEVLTKNPFHIRAIAMLYKLLLAHGLAERGQPLLNWLHRLDPQHAAVQALAQLNLLPEVAPAPVVEAVAEPAPALVADKPRIAVVLHLYYPDCWPEFAKALGNIPEPFDLIITTVAEKRQEVLDLVDADYPAARIYLVENRGRDIGPLFKLLEYEALENYELVLKLHTKKSLHQAEGNGDLWRTEILNGLLPPNGVANILGFLDAHPETGLAAQQSSLCSARRVLGANNENLSPLQDWLVRLGRDRDSLDYEFIAGDMFWSRGRLYAALRELGLRQEDFDDETGQVEGTLAHLIERLFPVVADLAGLQTAPLPAPIPEGFGNLVSPRYAEPYANWLLQRSFTLNEAHLIDARRSQLPAQPLRLYIIDRVGDIAAIASSLTAVAEQYHKPVQVVIVSPLPTPIQAAAAALPGYAAMAPMPILRPISTPPAPRGWACWRPGTG